jgi:acyl-coenzyme A synthetase/AMP-(fatty) acid ligase
MIGNPLPEYETYVLDEQMQPVIPGEIGELYIGGASVARGYLNQPKLTAERFVRNLFAVSTSVPGRVYRTFDLVRRSESGELQFIGRADGQIKIRGYRIELTEIEAVLMEHPSIRAAAVTIVEFGTLKDSLRVTLFSSPMSMTLTVTASRSCCGIAFQNTWFQDISISWKNSLQ